MVDNPGRAASPRRPQDAPKRSDLIFDAEGLPPAALERKHMLERDTDIYMTNNQFKDAMLACGFLPVNERELNWHYCISRRSPAFTHVGGTYGGV